MNTETLRALAMAATPGPYKRTGTGAPGVLSEQMRDGKYRNVCNTWEAHQLGQPGFGRPTHSEDQDEQIANAAYFAALDPATVLKLLDCVEALGEVEEYLGFWGVHDGAGPNEIADHGRVTELVKAALATPDAAQSGGEGE